MRLHDAAFKEPLTGQISEKSLTREMRAGNCCVQLKLGVFYSAI
jgi:hypothetical protein